MSDAAHFRLLAHTADIGLEAVAPTRNELFEVAARGRVGFSTSFQHSIDNVVVRHPGDYQSGIVWQMNTDSAEFIGLHLVTAQ